MFRKSGSRFSSETMRPRETMLRRFCEDRSGTVVMMAAGGLAVVLGIATVAIDVGSFYHAERRAQNAADLAALAAAQDLGHATRIASATVAANGIVLTQPLDVAFGTYRADPSVAPGARYQPSVDGAANAVRVSLHSDSTLFFGRALGLGDKLHVSVSATAAEAAFATFAIGSRLVSLDGGLLNQILGGTLGMSLNLTAMDYQALASAQVDLPKFLSAVAAHADLTAVTYSQVLAATVNEADVVKALGDALVGGTDDGAVAGALGMLAAAAEAAGGSIPLAGLVDLGPYGGLPVGQEPGTGVSVSALDLVSAMAGIAGGGHQVQLALDTDLPGIASVTLQLVVGEPAQGTSWVTVGSQGASVHTAQTRLLFTIGLLGAGSIPAVRLPIYLEIAPATAELSRLSCAWPDTAGSSATLDVTPGVADAWIGAVSDAEFTNLSTAPDPGPATLLSLAPAKVTGRAHAAIENLSPAGVDFNYGDIAAGTRKTVGTTDFAALLTTLLGDLDVQVAVGGLGVHLAVGPGVSALVGAAAPSIDTLVGNVLATLGVGVGQADVWLTGIRCDGAVLVD
jgi:uncharacterized membrane protein